MLWVEFIKNPFQAKIRNLKNVFSFRILQGVIEVNFLRKRDNMPLFVFTFSVVWNEFFVNFAQNYIKIVIGSCIIFISEYRGSLLNCLILFFWLEFR